MAAPTVVTIQPQFGGATSSVSRCIWQTGLMDCCTDCGVCECLGHAFLPPLLGSMVPLCSHAAWLSQLLRWRRWFRAGGQSLSQCCVSPPARLLRDVLLPLPGVSSGWGHERVLPVRDQRGHEDHVPHQIQHPGQC